MTDTNHTKSEAGGSFLKLFHVGLLLTVLAALAYFVYGNATNDDARFPFRLGLDLAGGSHLVYEADTTSIDPAEVDELMAVLREVIERRINVFGVSEPIVQVEQSSFASGGTTERLVVELPGVTDVAQAVAEIGKTPLLEFKLIDEAALQAQAFAESVNASSSGAGTAVIGNIKVDGEEVSNNPYVDTGLTGRYLASAALEFAGGSGGQLANEPIVSIVFNAEGGELFERITREHTGERLAIFLDGEMISAPNINEPISGGRAVISGGFTPDEARSLAQNLNFGALPVPITLASTQTIGASLGADLLERGAMAGVIGLSIVMVFMMLWYRVWGVMASISLLGYVIMMLALFQLIPVTLTAAGLAGFVLSLGMAVDANVLIFERIKEEWKAGKGSTEAAKVGFARAWGAIRDGNVTSILSAVILFWFGTSLVKGFALVFGLGVIMSMFSAIVVTRLMVRALPETSKDTKGVRTWFYQIGLIK